MNPGEPAAGRVCATRRLLACIVPLIVLWGPATAWILGVDPFAARAIALDGAFAGGLAVLIAFLLTRRVRPPSPAHLALVVTALALIRWLAQQTDPRVPYIESFSVLALTLALGWSACLAVFLIRDPIPRPALGGARPRVTVALPAAAAALGVLTAAVLGVALSARAGAGVDDARLTELDHIADLLTAAITHGDPDTMLATLDGDLYVDALLVPGSDPPAWITQADAIHRLDRPGAPRLIRFDSARFQLVHRPVGEQTLWLWQPAGVGPPIRAPDDGGAILILGLLMLGAPLGAWMIGRDLADQLGPLTDALDRIGRDPTPDRAPDPHPQSVPQASDDEIGDLAAHVGTAIDRAAARNRRLAAEASVAAGSDRSRTGFLYAASHELRTPLDTINGYCHLLGTTDLTDAQREDIRVIADASAQLLAHVDEIIDLSRIESGREATLDRAPTDLAALIRDALAARPAPADLTVTFTAEDTPPVPCDRARIRQVVTNLIDNAYKFTAADTREPGGAIELDLRPDTHDGAPAAHLTITDTGPGIPPDELEAIFVEFHRVAAQRGVTGTGLGLAIARRLVQRHGGRLWAESTLGDGATFHLVLPTAAPEAAA